jgi:hypothetical protein
MKQLKFDNESVFLKSGICQYIRKRRKKREIYFQPKKFSEPRIVIIVIIFRKFTKGEKERFACLFSETEQQKTGKKSDSECRLPKKPKFA